MTGPGSTVSECSFAGRGKVFRGSAGPRGGSRGSSRRRRTDFTRAGPSARRFGSLFSLIGLTCRRSNEHVECSSSCGASREKPKPFTNGSSALQRSSPNIHITDRPSQSVPHGLTVTRRKRPPGGHTSNTIERTSRTSARHRRDGVGASSEPSFRLVPSGPSCGLRAIRHWRWPPRPMRKLRRCGVISASTSIVLASTRARRLQALPASSALVR